MFNFYLFLAVVAGVVAFWKLGVLTGKEKEKQENMEKGVDNAFKIKNAIDNRANDARSDRIARLRKSSGL